MNTQKLMDLIKINEEAKRFDLSSWVHNCGTYGCLAGNYWIVNYKGLENRLSLQQVAQEFEITDKEAYFLFASYDFTKEKYGIRPQYGSGPSRNRYDRTAALNRVRKFLYYKLHKQEMMYDNQGCIKESAKKAEGNQHVMRKVLECIK